MKSVVDTLACHRDIGTDEPYSLQVDSLRSRVIASLSVSGSESVSVLLSDVMRLYVFPAASKQQFPVGALLAVVAVEE
jgi:hypothetical protein